MPDTVAFLSEPWCAAFASAAGSLPARPGSTARMSTVVVGGPEGKKAERAWHCSLVDGQVVAAAAGALPDGEADLAITQPWDDAVAALRGDTTIDVSFMRGSTKVVGSMGTFMNVVPVLRSDEWRDACGSLAARTAL